MARKLVVALAALSVVAMTTAAMAVSYASGAKKTGSDLSFTLNEDAANVTIKLDGGGEMSLGAMTKGSHTVGIGASASWKIAVSTSTAPGWTKISNDADNTSKYYVPLGVGVNRNAASPYFGSIYVSNAMAGTTASGRAVGDGLYVMGADQSDITSQGDTAYTGGADWGTSTSTSPFRIEVADDGQVYICDWSDTHSGVWRAPADLSGTWNQVFANETNSSTGAGGLYDNHGSVPGMYVEGSGASTVLYTVDEDYLARGDVNAYAIGNNETPYTALPTKSAQDGTNILLNGLMDVCRDEDGSWWISQYRSTQSAGAPGIVRFEDGGSAPVYNSALDPGMNQTATKNYYGVLAIFNEGDLLATGARNGQGVYVMDISNPDALTPTIIAHSGRIRDLAFDAAGNLYVVSNTTETLRIFSPGGSWLAMTDSDGRFVLVPEPVTVALLGFGALALLRRRRA